jgi:hypothetical protein
VFVACKSAVSFGFGVSVFARGTRRSLQKCIETRQRDIVAIFSFAHRAATQPVLTRLVLVCIAGRFNLILKTISQDMSPEEVTREAAENVLDDEEDSSDDESDDDDDDETIIGLSLEDAEGLFAHSYVYALSLFLILVRVCMVTISNIFSHTRIR